MRASGLASARAESLMAYLATQAGIQSLAALPEGLVAFKRGAYLILLNFTDTPLEARTMHGTPILVGPRDVQIINLLTANHQKVDLHGMGYL
jgi:hypothetical protein